MNKDNNYNHLDTVCSRSLQNTEYCYTEKASWTYIDWHTWLYKLQTLMYILNIYIKYVCVNKKQRIYFST